jgi:hypothetical protein
MMAFIKITYKKDGSVVTEPKGFGGDRCYLATRRYDRDRGGSTEESVTDEMYDEPPVLSEPETETA